MPGPRQNPTNFPEILEYVWWRLDRALDEDGIRQSGLVGALDAVRAGTTTLVDHHASPGCIGGSLDLLADALEGVGVRSVLCYEVTDRNGEGGRLEGLRENERFLRENRRSLTSGLVGAHASFTLDDASLRALSELADAFHTGIHIHVAEDVCDAEDSVRRCGMRVADRLERFGILRDRSICAHCVHLDGGELETVRRSRSWLVHNCRSNMNNRVGRAPIAQFGDRAALGTDGIDEDMFAESRTAFFRAREDDLSTGAERIASLLAGSAALASQFFPWRMGVLEAGAAADLIVLDYDPPTPLSDGNLAWHWTFAFTSGVVESAMVGGEWVLRKGECVTVDEEKVRAEARAQAARLWQRMDEM
jgi:putative selenium metabolism protein SsnA